MSAVLGPLSEVGNLQSGYFVTGQAAGAGIDRHQLQRLVSQGLLEREGRGLYRIALFPENERAELWRAVLWPLVQRNGARGVVSDGTALDLYAVSTINPPHVDITVPRQTRLRRERPPGIRVRYRNYGPADVTTVEGLPVTTLYRTLLDLIMDGRELQFVDESLERSVGTLTRAELRNLRALRQLDSTVLNQVRTKQ